MVDERSVRPTTLAGAVRPDDVSVELDRIARSAALGRSDQLVRFLRFVVAETLDGRGHLLKEYTIGVEALGRGPRFDPTTDAVVRVQARQLRFKLAEYFASEGQSDSIRIELPKGSYVPVFVPREPPTSSARVPVAASPPNRARPRFSPWSLIALFAAAAVIAALALPRAGPARSSDGGVETQHALVVLPFLNLTGDHDQDYVSDGVTDELTAALAKVPNLRVIARTSAFQFKSFPTDVRTIGRRLGVDDVVEGSVRRVGDVVRITVQLNRASDGVHLWAASFDEPSHDLLEAEETVARSVVAAFGRTLSPSTELAAPGMPTRDAAAYALYLKALYYTSRRDLESMHRAVALFREAIGRDSGFALAFAGLAGAQSTMAINSQSAPGAEAALAEMAARHALALDSTLGEAHATLGSMRAFVHWDWAGADAEFRRAIALSPNFAAAHSRYATTLMARGRLDEALEQLRYAQRLNPLSMPIAYSIGEALVYARRWDEAIAQAHTVLELDSTYLGAYNLLWRVYAETGRYGDALDAMAKARDSIAQPLVLARMGRLSEARARIAALPTVTTGQVPYFVACLHAAMGDRNTAFAWLDRAYASHQPDIVSMKIDPMMDPLRGDRRFDALLRRIGLGGDGTRVGSVP